MASIKANFFILCGLVAVASCQQLSGSASSNPQGGQDIVAVGRVGAGSPDLNVVGGVFAAGNTDKMAHGAPPTLGGFAGLNVDGHGLSLEKTITPGIQSTMKENARINFFDDKTHKVDTNLFHSRTHLDKPNFTFDKYGASLDYSHTRGHGASVGMSNIPNIGSNLDITGRANLWSSPDRMTSFDLTGTHTRGLSGQFAGQNNWGAGVGLTHRW
uniref:Attactin TY1 n=1 Tax=Tabanus yao TaxID=485572 RepID=C1IBY7_TABYA|nr:attactin TY1 [Tabanus yao]